MVTWGDAVAGGDSSNVQDQLHDVRQAMGAPLLELLGIAGAEHSIRFIRSFGCFYLDSDSLPQLSWWCRIPMDSCLSTEVTITVYRLKSPEVPTSVVRWQSHVQT